MVHLLIKGEQSLFLVHVSNLQYQQMIRARNMVRSAIKSGMEITSIELRHCVQRVFGPKNDAVSAMIYKFATEKLQGKDYAIISDSDFDSYDRMAEEYNNCVVKGIVDRALITADDNIRFSILRSCDVHKIESCEVSLTQLSVYHIPEKESNSKKTIWQRIIGS
jgi:hypothetical protein